MMLRLGLLSALVVGLVLGQAYQPDYRTKFSADKDFLAKQKKIYHVLAHYFQPELKPELQKEGHEYNVEAHADSYTNKHAVKDFLHRAEHGFLPHDSVFSVYYPHTLDQTLAVFRLMYYAKDFDAFHKTALYLRNVLNPGMFLYAYNLAVLHRPDTKYMRLPALYELAPHYFYNVELLEKAHHVKKYGKLLPKHSAGYDTYVIPYNYSNYYLSDEYDYEQRLNYFTEDIGLNNYYFYFRANVPFFLGGEELAGQAKSYRGEEYLYGHQMLFNRYFLERLSQGLPHVEDYDYHGRFYAGYWPSMSYPNGMHFPSRPSDSHLPKSKLHWIQDAAEYESRIGQAVDSGIAFTKEGKTTKLYGAANQDDGLNILGNMIEGNVDSVNEQYYGRIDWLQRKILGFNLAPMSPEKLHPSALEHETTSLRDPAFWRIYKRLLHYYQRYKHNQGAYKPEEISYPELKIERVETDRLETYFDHFDSSIGHGLYVDHVAEAEAYVIQARQHRLNHKHFNVNLEVHAAKPTKAAIRIFLGPKYNVHMKELDFKDHHDEFYEMDNFIYDLAAGPNKIVRNCHDFFFVSEDPEPYEVFLQRIGVAADAAATGGEELKLEKRVHGFPARLLLPKGRPEGMPFQLFVHVAPVLAEPVHYTSRVFGDSLMDNRPLGYPLDRPISQPDFHGPNFYFKDVLIYHQQEHDKTVHY